MSSGQENLNDLVKVGEALLKKPVSRLNFGIGKLKLVYPEVTNEEALVRMAKMLFEERARRKRVVVHENAALLSHKSFRADGSGEDYKLLPSGPASLPDEQVPISHNDDNVHWKELLMLVYQLQSPLRSLKPNSYAKAPGCGIVAGMVGSLLGLGGGFILGPLFLELGFPPWKILSRNPWQGKITEEVWIQKSLIIGFDHKSSTAISSLDRIKELYICHPIGHAANAHAGHQHRSGLQRHVRRLDGHTQALLSRPGPFLNPKHNTQPLFFFNLIVVSLSHLIAPSRQRPPSASLDRLAPA
ncbi:unnamed protein product [Prunus armeniaca]